MKRLFGLVLTLAAMSIAADAALAYEITQADIRAGAVSIKGRNAPSGARVVWEGRTVGRVRRNGRFDIATTILPADCVGSLRVGRRTTSVIIANCAPHDRPGISVVELVFPTYPNDGLYRNGKGQVIRLPSYEAGGGSCEVGADCEALTSTICKDMFPEMKTKVMHFKTDHDAGRVNIFSLTCAVSP